MVGGHIVGITSVPHAFSAGHTSRLERSTCRCKISHMCCTAGHDDAAFTQLECKAPLTATLVRQRKASVLVTFVRGDTHIAVTDEVEASAGLKARGARAFVAAE